jgi:hypothetical protein
MGSVTGLVRQALAELGPDAPDQKIKAFVCGQDSSVPESHVSLALRKLRRKVIPTERKPSRAKRASAKPSQGELFPE